MSVQPGDSVRRFTNQQSLQQHDRAMARGAIPARKTSKPPSTKQFVQQQKSAGTQRDPYGIGNTGEVAKQQTELRAGHSVSRFHTPQTQQQAQARTAMRSQSQSMGR